MPMAKEINSHKRSLLILTGFTCNNNCLICSIRGKEKGNPDRGFRYIAEDLRRGAEDGYEDVEFTGGEPTIRGDIADLTREAVKLGYKTIALSTNGRLFSYEGFSDLIIAAGLNKVTFSLLGPTEKIHDAVTRTPGSFAQMTAGIKNLQKNKNVRINISSVISRLNYKNLPDFGKFIIELGVKRWYLLDLIPDGNARLFYPRLAVKLEDLYNEFSGLKEIAGYFDELGFFDFPPCLFEEEFRNEKNIVFINTKKRADMSRQVGYDPERVKADKNGKYHDVYRINVGICGRCRYYKECGGIWKEYLDTHGEKEVSDLAAKNKCLI
ncbi:MAG: radical SAM protein [Candidatus Falkowbacteria bacterium]